MSGETRTYGNPNAISASFVTNRHTLLALALQTVGQIELNRNLTRTAELIQITLSSLAHSCLVETCPCPVMLSLPC